MLRGICVNTKPELEERIYQYFEEINREPVVYHWKYKWMKSAKLKYGQISRLVRSRPVSYMGKVAALLYARYKAGQKPIAMVSTQITVHIMVINYTMQFQCLLICG